MTMQEKNSKDISINKLRVATTKIENRNKIKQNSQWYNLRPILGHFSNYAIFGILIGGRQVGKSYSVTNFFVDQ